MAEMWLSRVLIVVAAVILGLAVIVTPLLFLLPTGFRAETSFYGDVHGNIIDELSRRVENLRRGTMDVGQVGFPVSLIHAGLILLLGLACAVILQSVVRKRRLK